MHEAIMLKKKKRIQYQRILLNKWSYAILYIFFGIAKIMSPKFTKHIMSK